MNTKRRIFRLAPLLVLLLAACSAEAPDPSSTTDTDGEARAHALLADYDEARGQGNWTGAAQIGAELLEKYPDSGPVSEVTRSLPDIQAKADALIETKRQEALWDYQAIEAGKGVQRSASIDSYTAPAEEGEFAQPADGKLILRDHPEWGRSAYLILNETAFRCGSPCAMQIAFDDGGPTRWAGKQADSGKGPALFINDEARFITELEKSKAVRVTLPKDSGHIRSLRFDVAGFRRQNYETAKPGVQ